MKNYFSTIPAGTRYLCFQLVQEDPWHHLYIAGSENFGTNSKIKTSYQVTFRGTSSTGRKQLFTT
jgi:hypothetical protein